MLFFFPWILCSLCLNSISPWYQNIILFSVCAYFHINNFLSISPLVLLHNTLHSQADFIKKLTQTISWTAFVLIFQTQNQWVMIMGWKKKSSSGKVQCFYRGKAKQYIECALWREAQIRILINTMDDVDMDKVLNLSGLLWVGFGVWKAQDLAP